MPAGAPHCQPSIFFLASSWVKTRAHLIHVHNIQVQKSELIVGARMGGDAWELDELEVRAKH